MTIENFKSAERIEWRIAEPLRALKVFSKLEGLMDKKCEIEAELKRSEDPRMRELRRKQYRKVDFLVTSISAVFFTYLSYYKLRKENDPEGKAKATAKKLIEEFIRELAYNTEDIEVFQKEGLKELTNWIGGTEIEGLIDKIDNGKGERKTQSRYARAVIAHSLGLKESNVGPYIIANVISEVGLRSFTFSVLLQALLIYVFGNDFYPFGIESRDLVPGKSRLYYHFDGLLRLLPNKEGEKTYLLKLVNLSIACNEIIDRVGVALQDVKETVSDIVDDKTNAIVFAPGHPSPDSLARELYWRTEAKINLSVLYCVDFFELFHLWEKKKVERFLVEKLK